MWMILLSLEMTVRSRYNLRIICPRFLKLKDLGILKYFLGIEVAYSKVDIFLSQRKYILDLLHETGLLGGKGASTPVEFNVKLCDKGQSVKRNIKDWLTD